VNAFSPLDEAAASRLVAQKDGVPYSTFNPKAKGWAQVDFSILWVSEQGPNKEVVSGKDSTQTMRVNAVIELDRAASDPQAKIIGGEYVEGPNGESRLAVPPFVWSPNGMGPENPSIQAELVKQLISMGQQQ
jgi:hypothetical protein